MSLNFTRKRHNEDELKLKLKQVYEVTNCNEELAIITLHDCNYNVEYAINKILTNGMSNEGEWKTKKPKQKKIPPKEKENEKSQDIEKEKVSIPQDINIEKDLDSIDKKNVNSIKKDISYGRTFKNYNLVKVPNCTNYVNYNSHQKIPFRPEINFFIDGKWNGKSIIIENSKFTHMPVKEITIKNKNNSCERQEETDMDEKKKQVEDSILFKTHCTTKPPPKAVYSLVAPVQIINKTVKCHTLPKFKFGDTDFIEDFKKSDVPFKSDNSSKQSSLESKFVDMVDNSIIKIGPPQKIESSPLLPNFQQEIFNATGSFYNINNFSPKTQSNLNNNVKLVNDFQTKNSNEVFDYSYKNISNHDPSANLPNLTSINQFNSSMSPKEITLPPNSQDLFLNHSSAVNFTPQSNMNHVKSTIYLLPSVMMNSLNGLYMTVNNPVPTRTLSPPIVTIPSQFNIPQHHPSPVYFDESLQPDDITNKNLIAMRQQQQFNSNRHQNFPRYKKTISGDLLAEDLAMKNDFVKTLPNMKATNLTNLSLNQNAISKQIPINYQQIYISPVSLASQNPNHSQMFMNHSMNTNSFNHNYQNNLQAPQGSNNENVIRKRNNQMQNGNFNEKSWS